MRSDSYKILIFTTAFRPFIGGSEIAIEEIAKRLPDFSFDIITPLYTRKLKKEEELNNMRIHRVGWGWLKDKFLFPYLGFLRARELLGDNDDAIIHAYQASHAAGAAWLLKIFNPKLKFLLTLQEGKELDSQSGTIKFFRRLIIKKADHITAISNYLKSYAKKFNNKAKVDVIPNGVDISNFTQEYSYGDLSVLADKLSIRPGDKVVITVSRLVPKNGIDILVRALEILRYKIQDTPSSFATGQASYKLLIAGEGEQREDLKLQVESLKLQNNVIWAGSVSHADLPKYLKISNVFVRPSRSEGLGNAFLEAMAADVPVIGTDIGGIPDFLKNGETGLFCKTESPEDLADKINTILTDEKLREKIIKNGRELVAREYNWDKIATRFSDLYHAYAN